MGRSDYDLYYSLQNCLHGWGGGGQDLSISKKNKKILAPALCLTDI